MKPTTAIISLAISVFFAACSSHGADSNSSNTSGITNDARNIIIKTAQTDAQKAVQAPDDKQREGIILNIKAKESRLRSEGFNAHADLYISTTRHLIDSLTH